MPPHSPSDKKDLVIGVFFGYDLPVLKPWIRSIKQTGFTGDICLIALDAETALLEQIRGEGVMVVPMRTGPNSPKVIERFLHVFDFLQKQEGKYRFVVFADVSDLVFQQNPIPWLEKNLIPSGKKLVAAGERILVEHEEWNANEVRKNFGDYFYNIVKHKEVQCGGVIAGYADYVRDMCLMVFEMCVRVPYFGADQAAYIILMSIEPWWSVTLHQTLADAWVLNAQVTSQPDMCDTYEPYLLESRPTFDGSTVRNADGKPFAIVHQYDRIPEWTNYFTEKYL